MNFKHGDKVTCYIGGVYIEYAQISIDPDDRPYICQNIFDGDDAQDKLGYKYSYSLNYDFTHSLNRVTDLKLADTRTEITWGNLQEGDVFRSSGRDHIILGICGKVIFVSFPGDKDSVRGMYTKDELIIKGYTIKQPTSSQPIPDETQKAIELLQANGYKVTKE